MRYRRTGLWLEAQVNDELLMMEVESGRFVALNETGAYLWSRLAEPKSADELADGLCATFAVEPRAARADLHGWLDAMRVEQAIEDHAA